MAKRKKKLAPQSARTAYSGEVTVSVMRGSSVISKQKHHNDGGEALWKFVANALAGNFDHGSRPSRIQLYSDKELSVPASERILTDTAATTAKITDKQSGETIGWSATLYFRIPYARIFSPEVAGMKLYGRLSADAGQDSEVCALHTLEEPIEGIDPTTSKNYSLVIEWKLQITNVTIDN